MNNSLVLKEIPPCCSISTASLDHRFDAPFYEPRWLRMDVKFRKMATSISLGEIINHQHSGYGCLPDSDDYGSGVVGLIRGGELAQTTLSSLPAESPRVSEDYLIRYERSKAEPGDVLMLVKGATIARDDSAAILAPTFRDKALFNGSVFRLRILNGFDPYFVVAHLKAPMFLKQKERSVSNTGIWYLDQDTLLSLRLCNPSKDLQHAIGHKVRSAERLRSAAESNVCEAQHGIDGLIGTEDYSALKPNTDGSCNYFSGFIAFEELGLFHGAQFYAPKRKQAVALIKATGIAERLGTHGHRVRAKGNQKTNRGHVDPANVSGGDGYWYSGDSSHGGDVVLAKPGHTLFLRMRPYLNKTTINDSDQVVSGSPEFLVYEFEGLDAYYATLCLRQPWALAQVAEIATGDRPRVDGEFVDEVMVPWPEEPIRHEIGQLYKSSFALRRRADQLVQQAIADVENLIDGKLDEDQCLSEGRKLAEEFGLEVP